MVLARWLTQTSAMWARGLGKSAYTWVKSASNATSLRNRLTSGSSSSSRPTANGWIRCRGGYRDGGRLAPGVSCQASTDGAIGDFRGLQKLKYDGDRLG